MKSAFLVAMTVLSLAFSANAFAKTYRCETADESNYLSLSASDAMPSGVTTVGVNLHSHLYTFSGTVNAERIKDGGRPYLKLTYTLNRGAELMILVPKPASNGSYPNDKGEVPTAYFSLAAQGISDTLYCRVW
jgi:hypothetical protein